MKIKNIISHSFLVHTLAILLSCLHFYHTFTLNMRFSKLVNFYFGSTIPLIIFITINKFSSYLYSLHTFQHTYQFLSISFITILEFLILILRLEKYQYSISFLKPQRKNATTLRAYNLNSIQVNLLLTIFKVFSYQLKLLRPSSSEWDCIEIILITIILLLLFIIQKYINF